MAEREREALAAELRRRVAALTAPADPLAAVAAARDLRAAADAALRVSVTDARAAGRTWQEIGDLLGTSRQAAFQRFGAPIDPRTGELMAQALLADAGERATQLFLDYHAGDWDAVAARFDPTMKEGLPPARIAATAAQLAGTVGAYERMGEPLVRQQGDYTVVDLPLHYEAGDLVGRVSYDAVGQVAGLFVLRPDAA